MADYHCVDCGDPIGGHGTRCKSCAAKAYWATVPVGSKLRRSRTEAASRALSAYWAANPVGSEARCACAEATRQQWQRGEHAGHDSWLSREVYTSTPESTGEKKRKIALAQWADPDKRQKVLSGLLQSEVQAKKSKSMKAAHARGAFDNVMSSPSKLELSVLYEFELLGMECVSQYRPMGCSYVYDIYLPEFSTVIEVDGAYWHSLPGAAERDADKDEWAVTHGYDIVRFGELEVKKFGPCDVVVQTCTEFGWI